MKTSTGIKLLTGLILVVVAGVFSFAWTRSGASSRTKHEESRAEIGFRIAPVPLIDHRSDDHGQNDHGQDDHGVDWTLVGEGSYIVNAQGGCNDCHTCPSYAPGHDPYQGEDGKYNADNYLAGGVAFGPFISDNITPDATGKPAGLTEQEFISLIRTGRDPHSGDLLQVMPWPVYRQMQDRDLKAIYAYLSVIPHKEPGTCN